MRIINADGWLSEEATMLHPPRARLVFFSPVLHPINSAVTLPYLVLVSTWIELLMLRLGDDVRRFHHGMMGADFWPKSSPRSFVDGCNSIHQLPLHCARARRGLHLLSFNYPRSFFFFTQPRILYASRNCE